MNSYYKKNNKKVNNFISRFQDSVKSIFKTNTNKEKSEKEKIFDFDLRINKEDFDLNSDKKICICAIEKI